MRGAGLATKGFRRRALMKSFLAAFTFALLAGLLLTPLVRRIALSKNVVARTSARHIHAGRIPRVGGIALALGWCLALLAFLPTASFAADILGRARPQLVGLTVGALALCVVGAVDDIRGVRVAHKLIAQVLVAAFAYACEFRIE